MLYQNYYNVFVILNYEMPADSAVYLCIYTELESGDGCNTFCISFSFSETICIRKPEL